LIPIANNPAILKLQQSARAMTRESMRDIVDSREKELAKSFEDNKKLL